MLALPAEGNSPLLQHSKAIPAHCTGGVTAPALPHCSCHCSSKGAGTSPQSDPSSRPGKVQGFERYQIQKPREAPELWPTTMSPGAQERICQHQGQDTPDKPPVTPSCSLVSALTAHIPWRAAVCISAGGLASFWFQCGMFGVFLVLSGLGLLGVF